MMFLNTNTEHVSVNPMSPEIATLVENYKFYAFIVGLLIIVTNLSVVVTSGLILKKAVQPKSTYMLLGNISLADTVLGMAMVVSSLMDKSYSVTLPEDPEHSSVHTLCMFVQGTTMCSAVVSVHSISLIAADRYVYLLHGLYYKTWISTKRVRISILCIWVFGILLTVPGWLNVNKITKCHFIHIFPVGQMLTMVAISFINIGFVTTLYTIILVKAINANNKIQKAKKIAQIATVQDKSNSNDSEQTIDDNNSTANTVNAINFTVLDVQSLDSVNDALSRNKILISIDPKGGTSESSENTPVQSTIPVYEDCSASNKVTDTSIGPSLNRSVSSFIDVNKVQNKCKNNKKWRAIAIVILTTGTFIITWTPFLICVVYYGYVCEKIHTTQYCEISWQHVIRPSWSLALLSNFLNPFIYAWWHSGFKKYAKTHFKKYFCKVVK